MTRRNRDRDPASVIGPKVVKVGFEGVPPTAADLKALPRLLDRFREEVRASFEVVGIKIDQAFARIEKRLDTHTDSIAEHGVQLARHDTSIADLKQRVASLEQSTTRPRAKKKR